MQYNINYVIGLKVGLQFIIILKKELIQEKSSNLSKIRQEIQINFFFCRYKHLSLSRE